MGYDVVVVGAGFAGSVIAERVATAAGSAVLSSTAGDHRWQRLRRGGRGGILVHRYGPHIFHTNAAEIFDYLSQFTAWRPYEHRVLASVRGALVPIPINRTTLNTLFAADSVTTTRSRRSTGRAPRTAPRREAQRTSSSDVSAGSCTSCSSAAIRGSSGASTPRSWTRR